ncbi:MAG: bacteriohemerythrin [Magnetococcales bacterium]|nr:bacteriohemerythrin [Magnetococcales bacterium]
MKALSNQTVEATQTIARLVESIQGKTRNASSEVAEITTLVDRITQANREIAGAVAEQTRSIGRIAESVQQVAKATGSVLANAQQMAQVARQVDEGAVRTTSSTAEIARLSAQSAASADDMRAKSEEAFTFSQAIQESLQRTEKASGVVAEKIADSVSVVNAMQGSVNHFRSLGDVASNISDALLAAQSNLDVGVEPFDVRLMKEVHLKLLGRLERAANGLDQLTSEEIGDGPSCPLGQWITGAGAEMLGDAVILNELRDVHNLTHQTAQDVFNYLAMGERSAAMNAVRLFHELRASLFELLNRIYLGETKQPDHSQPWMEWHDRFTLGIPALDQDHQEVIAQLVVIYRAFATNSGMAVILQHLDRFVQVTRGHFVREEEVMGRQGYPDLKNHKQEHALFLKKIEEFIHKLRRENLPFSQEMALYMKNWLTQHLQGEDSRFVHFANRKGKG